MKKHTEKPPIDDLFARKLGNTSLPPSRDGFERLQSRMKQNEPEVRVIFWRDPQVQRYMAVAACLLLVCLFGWLYLAEKPAADGQLATTLATEKAQNKNQPQRPNVTPESPVTGPQPSDQVIPGSVAPKADVEQLVASSQPNGGHKAASSVGQAGQVDWQTRDTTPPSLPVAVAQNQPVADKTTPDPTSIGPVMAAGTPASEQVASNVVKPAPATERVLVVTIAEPASLVAARQAANESIKARTAVAVNEKPDKETKAVNIWQQVNRIRQGEVFARRDNSDDERGLIGRAYNGLKHSLDKDKPAKQ